MVSLVILIPVVFSLYLSFVDYCPPKGLFGSPFVGFANYSDFISSYSFGRTVGNSLFLWIVSFVAALVATVPAANLCSRFSHRKTAATCAGLLLLPAEVIGRFDDNRPAIFRNSYGNGSTKRIGTAFFQRYLSYPTQNNLDYLKSLLPNKVFAGIRLENPSAMLRLKELDNGEDRIMVNTTIQINSADHMRGRVMSVYSLVFGGVIPIGSLIAGNVSEHTGAPNAMVIFGVIGILSVSCTTYLMRKYTPNTHID